MKFKTGKCEIPSNLQRSALTALVSILLVTFSCVTPCRATENSTSKSVFQIPSDPIVLEDLRDALREVRQSAHSPEEKVAAVELLLKLNKSSLFRTVSKDLSQISTNLETTIAALGLAEATAQRQGQIPYVARTDVIKGVIASLLRARLINLSNPQAAIKAVGAFARANQNWVSKMTDKPQSSLPSKAQLIASLQAAKITQSPNLQKVTDLQITLLQSTLSTDSSEARIAAVNTFTKANAAKLQAASSKVSIQTSNSSQASR